MYERKTQDLKGQSNSASLLHTQQHLATSPWAFSQPHATLC